MKGHFPILLLTMLATSCSVLKPVKDTSVNHLLDPTIPEKTLSAATPAVAVGRPSLPGYLDRQQLVSRSGAGKVEMNPFQLWLEPLDTGISRVVAENLSRLSGSVNIRTVDNFTSLDYSSLVELRIRQFEPTGTGVVKLECTWKLQQINGIAGPTRFFKTEVPINGLPDAEYSGRLAAMNEALGQLSREIYKALK